VAATITDSGANPHLHSDMGCDRLLQAGDGELGQVVGLFGYVLGG